MLDRLRAKKQVVNIPLKYEETPVKKPGKVPEVRQYTKNAKEKVFAFLQLHNDQLITQEEIARGSGTAKSKVGKLIKELVDEGRIVSSEPIPRVGTRYFVNESVQNSQEEVAPPPSDSEGAQQVTLSAMIETLIWQFIKDTRSTDVLQFLTWIEQKKSGV